MRIEVVDAMALEGSAVSAALISDLREKIGDATPDVALLFLSSAYFEHAEAIATRIVEEIGAAHFVGVCSSSVIGNEREFENEAAASLWTAQLPEYAEAQSFGIKRRRAGAYEFEGQEGQFADPATLFLFSIPGTFSEKDFLSTLRESQPESQVLGGRTCGERGQQLLFHAKGKTVGDPFRREEGAVAINLAEVYVCAVVSQGCRPFGKASTITKADGNELQQLGSHSASERFDEEVESLSLDERRLLKPGAHIGRLLHTSRARGEHGDFQISQIEEVVRATGRIKVDRELSVSDSVRFHLRDPRAAHEHFASVVHAAIRELASQGFEVAGALLFADERRGRRLFGEDDHDLIVVRELTRTPTCAGFFSSGQFAPIGETNFEHQLSAVVALFPRERV